MIRIEAEPGMEGEAGQLSKFGEVVEFSPPLIRLRVKRHRIIPVCKALLDELPIKDIDIEEIPIEEIIRRIFARPE